MRSPTSEILRELLEEFYKSLAHAKLPKPLIYFSIQILLAKPNTNIITLLLIQS
jgi:hypothetical protein